MTLTSGMPLQTVHFRVKSIICYFWGTTTSTSGTLTLRGQSEPGAESCDIVYPAKGCVNALIGATIVFETPR